MLNECNIVSHYVTKHAEYGNILSAAQRQKRATDLDRKLVNQKDFLRKDKIVQKMLIFLKQISENFDITEELLSMESMKDTNTGESTLECAEYALYLNGITMEENDKYYQRWFSIIRLTDRVGEVDFNKQLTFFTLYKRSRNFK
ncbi:hypothetical protein RF11_06319 [Thelohanellus kitauei]|uniref:Uncharacterized protein n=1 Tax=Thelohanellus kitauei TaxID=669202 RepID=A0A0C2N2M9_THEKT|nr:hypothetical protein RF11_06319 [Thelohanellus kitauei]